METVKVKDKKTGAVKEIKKSLAGDYVGTGNFVLFEEKKFEEKKFEEIKPKNNGFRKEE